LGTFWMEWLSTFLVRILHIDMPDGGRSKQPLQRASNKLYDMNKQKPKTESATHRNHPWRKQLEKVNTSTIVIKLHQSNERQHF
jgi:hypothetical protein